MRKFKLLFGLLVLAAFLLAACGSGTAADNVMSENAGNMGDNSDAMNNDEMMEEDSADDMMDSSEDDMADDAHDPSNDAVMENDKADDMMEDDQGGDASMPEDSTAELPAWFDYEFTDAATGQIFTVNDFQGKVIMIETMAVWCSNCLKQQEQVKLLHQQLGERDDFVSIGIGVDPNEDNVILATFADFHGFDWWYSVAPQELLSQISDSLGGQFLNPPSTPIVIIDKDGNSHVLPFGIKSVEELQSAVEVYLN